VPRRVGIGAPDRVPVIVLGELHTGLSLGRRSKENEAELADRHPETDYFLFRELFVLSGTG
jgi:hypothetical protein